MRVLKWFDRGRGIDRVASARPLAPARLRVPALTLWMLLVVGPALAQDVRVRAALSDDHVYVGDDIQYQIIIENSQDVTPPQLSAPDGLVIEYAGASQQPAPVFIQNGRRIDTGPDKYVLLYRVSATRTGVYAIPSQSIRVAGQEFTLPAVRLTASQAPEDPTSSLRASLSADTAYIGQPVTLTLRWTFTSAAQSVRFATDAPELAPMAARGYDLLAGPDPRPPGTRPDDRRYVTLQFDGQDVVCRMEDIGRNQHSITLTRTVMPTAAGQIEIGPFVANAQVLTGGDGLGIVFPGQGNLESRVSRGRPVLLNVRPLPTEGRPANFSGLVGQFDIATSAGPTELSVGDPIELHVTITGPEPLDRATPPDLEKLQAFTSGFRLTPEGLRAQSTQAVGQRDYSTTLRPTSDRVTAIPSLELAYFDVAAGEYRTARSEPIALKVKPTRQVTAQDAVVAVPPGSDQHPLVPGLRTPLIDGPPGLRANSTSLASLRNEDAHIITLLTQPAWASGLLLPPLAFAATGVYVLARRTAPSPGRRRREAMRLGLGQLRARRGSVARALRLYVGTRFDVPPDSVTSYDARSLLQEHPPESGDALAELLDRADGARLGGQTDPLVASPSASEAVALLRRLDAEARR